MGIYLNPGNENFREMANADIFVDKTMMIREINRLINSTRKYICMSRPRRFGKTYAGNMLSAYYSRGCDSSELFEGRKISSDPSFEENLNKYNVIQVDLNSEYQNTADKKVLMKKLTEKIKTEMSAEYPDIEFRDDDSVAESIVRIYSVTGDTFIIIIDEYDVMVREQVGQELFDEFLSFLNGLFKSNTVRPAISMAYMTGILPIVRDKIQSKLNNFDEYTILNPGVFSEFVGFTSEEVRDLCEDHDVDYEECRNWYDGYKLNGYEIYNPESVVKCVRERYFDSYWGKTSTYKVISERLEQNFYGTKDEVIKMLAGENVDVNVTSYLNTMDSFASRNDVFTYLIHLGYLAYDRDTKTCRIPNREIRQEWYNAVEVSDDYVETSKIIEASKELLNRTIRGDEGAVAAALDTSHMHVTSNRSYNNEDALQSAIYLAYIYALNKYTVVKEMTAGRGFADVVYIPFTENMPAMIIELKHNKCAESAIDQIRDKQYFDSLSHYSGNLLFVGINYDEQTKTHECKIERFEKVTLQVADF
ncbi:MAG: AAA family ATPase [Lachnospiraceae bacterium]|nr:AAA family ATPase [Lachnospiraceae bacterium]